LLQEIWLASPRGFCAGVERAIEIVERALEVFGAPVYVRHEIVHNRRVVDRLRQKGAVFVPEVDDAPEGAVLIFSAHGVAREVVARAKARGMRIIDATCPLVAKVHLEVQRHVQAGRQVIMIGHKGHPEVEGTMGQAPKGKVLLVETEADVARLQVDDPERVAYVTQTTLSVDDAARIIAALKKRFASIVGPRREDICYATTNRQRAVKALAQRCELVLVVGSPNSSNSNRLREVAERAGARAVLLEGKEALDFSMLSTITRLGITAGASAPEDAVQEIVQAIVKRTNASVHTLETVQESVRFSLPPILRDGAKRFAMRPQSS